MLFNSAVFVFFYLPIVWIVYILSLRLLWARAGIAWLGLASIFFYGYWNPAFVPLLAASILFNYGVGRLLDSSVWDGAPRGRKALLTTGVGVNLIVLGYYKYANLLSSSAGALTGIATPVFDVILPLGISFYTFTQIAYLVDSHAERRSEKSFPAYVLFVTYFPHLIAGPLLHHREMMPQFLRDRRGVPLALVLEGLLFFACGLAKKVLIADSVAPAANRAFTLAEADPLGFVDSWFGALAYTIQIYFDFSGYSDMAIGLGLLFGIRLPLNFDSPYKSRSIVEFWRCWHMTLSRFLRDYLYIPLGGNRRGPVRRHINLTLTMLLGGLWHGASWTFLVWGGLHGLYLQVDHAWRQLVTRSPRLKGFLARHPLTVAVCGWALTFLAVVVAWVFFRAESFTGSAHMLAGMFGGMRTIEAHLVDPHTAFYITLGLLIAIFAPNSQELFTDIASRLEASSRRLLARPFLQGSHLGLLVFVIAALTLISVSWGNNEFIYFNF
jgi:D-alanyl-lipoteichoic acid acyltransferase DltB (MBOAT superfamily)